MSSYRTNGGNATVNTTRGPRTPMSIAEHQVTMSELAAERRRKGQKMWEQRIHVHAEGCETFEERRDAFVSALRASRWFKRQEEGSELPALVEELADAETGDDYDAVADAIYDEADHARVWIEVHR